MVVSVLGPGGNILCTVDQRRLYSKNGWPAKADIVKALQEMSLENEPAPEPEPAAEAEVQTQAGAEEEEEEEGDGDADDGEFNAPVSPTTRGG
jgi:hypothetical protein